MSTSSRSSNYSDLFELEDLVKQISQQARSQAWYEIRALRDERDTLHRQVEAERRAWLSMYQVMLEAANVGTQLSLVCANAQEQIVDAKTKDRERKQQLANLARI